MLNKKTIRDINVFGKRVLVRVDFNVPLTDGVVGDDNRIRAAIPTIQYLLSQGAALILCSHLGRPKGKPDSKYSLRPVTEYLDELIDAPVGFVEDCVGPMAEDAAVRLQPGQVLVLENTRFHAGETKNDPDMARQLAALADVYVNDAFGTAHRAHASTTGVAQHLLGVMGFLLEKEVKYLGQAIANPSRPYVAIIGGAKISDKIGVIRNLLDTADHVLIGGGMANTFFKSQGLEVADSLVEDEVLDTARELAGAENLHLPIDMVITDRCAEGADQHTVEVGDVPIGWHILDIGPKTVAGYAEFVRGAGTVVWNGPVGVFELPNFSVGTFGMACVVAECMGTSIIGGGDSVAAIKQSGLADEVTHLSTGGGATLMMLEGKVLPGLAALMEKG